MMKDIFQFKKVIDLRFSKRAAFAAVVAVAAVTIPSVILYIRKQP